MKTLGQIGSFGEKLLGKVIPRYYRPRGYLTRLTRRRSDRRVLAGPFKGMHYVDESVGSAYVPKILGIYELELADEIEEICAQKPTLIVDIGAAEGYYAIGLALRNPAAQIVAFEQDEKGRQLVEEMARLNHVFDRVDIRGKCELQDLQTALSGKPNATIVCDVEGYEEWLLDPHTVPALREATLLVETHDNIRPGILEKLQSRFAATHHVQCIQQDSRSRAHFPWRTWLTILLPTFLIERVVSEGREVRMSWLWMKPLDQARS